MLNHKDVMYTDKFEKRHIGVHENNLQDMLHTVGVDSLDHLVEKTLPKSIILDEELNIPKAITEYEFLNEMERHASKNKIYKSYIGLGYYDTITPSVIKRNILENPGWYTAYTPYQAEISQGRLEGLLNFQTMVSDLTGLPIANASLLDEATAAAEAMLMLFHSRSRQKQKAEANDFFVSDACFPQTIDVLKTRALPLGINLIIGNYSDFIPSDSLFGAIVQYPDMLGNVKDFKEFSDKIHQFDAGLVVATDLMSLTVLTPPGEWGADVVVGNSQRFGVPMGYGGPHAAFFATKEDFKRNIPGRIIGVSQDRKGKPALRMALQTREQHIRIDKATSNICTAQALLAIMAGMYAVYHGPKGLKAIGESIHEKTSLLADNLHALGYEFENQNFFDTITIKLPNEVTQEEIKRLAIEHQINFRYSSFNNVGVSINETTSLEDLEEIFDLFRQAIQKEEIAYNPKTNNHGFDDKFKRTSDYLTHPTFNSFHSESEMMRYIKSLENKDISLTFSMISLGSCTMKLNAASELMPISLPEFASIHPFAPKNQASGYHEIIDDLEKWICTITGFEAMSFQPNSGAQGEYAGLMVIMEYHKSRGEAHRNIALIPSSAHGTNPASAVMAGMKVVVVKCDEEGNIDVEDLKLKAEQNQENLAALMVTYPSTHGVFEEAIHEITETVHKYGGQVYMDGANMNAQVGLTNPAKIGADVCHLNLHKTFAIPHGGGGPGVGPIGVAKHLAPFLPGHCIIPTGGRNAMTAVSAAPYGSALILLISYGYLKMLGREGVKKATQVAILNANYLKEKLSEDFSVLYKGKNNMVAHEMIIDCREFKRSAGIEVEDIAKRLIDYGFHAPTVSFPVAGTIMVEPTESESNAELDRFVEAMLAIKQEIKEIELGISNENDNVIKNAPHTAQTLIADVWEHSYPREKAAYPVEWIRDNKYFPPVSRIENAYGDRNLICTCPPLELFAEH